MAVEHDARDGWRLPLLLLWICYVALGAFPIDLFYVLRAAGEVTTQRAFVNSYWLVYFAWVLFLSWFIVRRSLYLGMAWPDAIGRGLRMLIVAGVAFCPLRIVDVLRYDQIPDLGSRRLLLGFACAKVLALMLLIAVLTVYCMGRPRHGRDGD